MKSPPGIGLVGVGAWGRNHARVLQALGRLARVYDADAARLAGFAPTLCARSAEALIGDSAVDAVVIATPAPTHFALARLALTAGRDVFVEKPLTLNVAEADALAGLAAERGRVLMVGHVLAYHPALVRLRDLIDTGVLGSIRYVYSNRLNLGTVRESESILWSFAPHDLSVLSWLLRAAPEALQTVGSQFLRADRADVTVTHLWFPRGVQAHIFVSWLHPMKEHRLVVSGDRRMATFVDDGNGGTLTLFDVGVEDVGGEAVHRRAAGEKLAVPTGEPLRRELEHFIACVTTRATPETDGSHGAAIVRLLAAADESMRQGGTRVDLSASGGGTR